MVHFCAFFLCTSNMSLARVTKKMHPKVQHNALYLDSSVCVGSAGLELNYRSTDYQVLFTTFANANGVELNRIRSF